MIKRLKQLFVMTMFILVGIQLAVFIHSKFLSDPIMVSHEAQSEFNIIGPVGHISGNTGLLDRLKSAKKGEKITIVIDTVGGNSDTMYAIREAMLKSKAYIVAHVRKKAYSAGAIIAFSADEITFGPGAVVMFHHGIISFACGVRFSDVSLRNYLNDIIVKMQKTLRDCCSKSDGYFNLLTKGELDRIDSGEDVYISGDEIIRRLDGYRT